MSSNATYNNVLIVGGTGGLGTQLKENLLPSYDVEVSRSAAMDVLDESQVQEFFSSTSVPSVLIYMSVVNCDNLIQKTTEKDIKKQLGVNVEGFLRVVKGVLPEMQKKSFGRIIYISSILSRNTMKGAGVYGACKAFNDHLVKTIAQENARYGITANSIQLGYFNGGLTERVPPQILEEVIKKIPLRRLGNISELGNCVRFLINTEYVTGSNITLAGGLEAL